MKTISRTSKMTMAEILASENFEAMTYLKENRDWIIRQILKYNSRNQLVAAMHAVKEAVEKCTDSSEADEAVTDLAMLQNFDIRDFWDANDRKISERKKVVLS